MKSQKGITLVALIITIIVMLILVAVSVTVVIQSGLFDSAKNAAKETQNKAEEEANLQEVNVNGNMIQVDNLEQWANELVHQ